MAWRFNLQLFGGGPNSQQQNSDQYYQTLANDSNQMVGNFNSIDLPALTKLIPQLQSILQGNMPPGLMNSAMAPVNAQTSTTLNTLRSNPSGLANPNALYADAILGGQQSAGLAADNIVAPTWQSALSALQGVLGMGYNGASAGMSGLNNAAGGEANLGGQLWNQNNAWWQDALGAAGEAYGYKTGNYNNQPTANTSSAPNYGAVATPSGIPGAGNGGNWGGDASFNPYTSMLPNGTASTASVPISSMGPQP